MVKGIRMGLVAVLLLGSAQVFAASAAPASPITFWSLFQVLFGLGLVLLAVLGAAWALRRMQPSAWGGAGPLRVLAALPVGTRERVALIKVGDTQLLVGITATQVNTLHVLTQPIAEDAFRTTDALPQFQDWLKQAMEKRGAILPPSKRLSAWLKKWTKGRGE